MAIGVISSPASWLLGTVASPTWFQQVQDNINQSLKNITQGQTSQCVVTKGAAAGAIGTFLSAGTCFDMCGSVQTTVNAGAAGILGTVAFVTSTMSTATFVNGPVVLLTPLNSGAAALTGTSQVWAVGTQSGGFWTGWSLNVGANIAAAGNCAWSYLVFMC